MTRSDDRPFLWIPGEGPDPAALARMARAFPRPAEPMGEAWFMGEARRMYPALMGDPDAVPDGEIASALEEIASGTRSFGPSGEWTDWYHFLLPRVVGRGWDRDFRTPAELLVTGFLALHPRPDAGVPYGGFPADVLGTLGRREMSPDLWPGGRVDAVRCLGKWRGPAGVAGWGEAGGLLAASLFLVARLLPAEAVEPWFRSVLAIPDPRWRVGVAAWLVGAHPVLTGEVRQPDDLPEDRPCKVSWSWSHALRGGPPLVPRRNREAVLRVARGWDAEAAVRDLSADPGMAGAMREVEGLPLRFLGLYG